MDTHQSLTYAQKLVDHKKTADLKVWTLNQSEFAVHTVVEYALKNHAWESLAVLFECSSCNKILAATVLRRMVVSNNIEAVTHLVSTVNPFFTESVDERTTESAVKHCVKTNNRQMLDILLEGGKKFQDTRSRYYREYEGLLFYAAEYDHAEMFQHLIERDSELLNEISIYNLLSECIVGRSYNVLQMVLDHAPSAEDSALELAIQHSNIECMHMVKNSVTEEEFTDALVGYCAQQGDLNILGVFGLDPYNINWDPQHVHTIIRNGNLELFRHVVPHKCSYTLSASDYSYLCNNNDEDRVLPFLDWMVTQVNPQSEESEALMYALSNKKWKMVERLLPLSDVNMVAHHYISNLSECPNTDVIDQVCARVGNHIKQEIFETAAYSNNMVVLQHLINDVNPKYNRSTALENAYSNNSVEAVEFLLAHSDVSANDFALFQNLAQKKSVWPTSVVVKALQNITDSQQPQFKEWMSSRANTYVKEALQHALNTMERDTIQSALTSSTLFKKRKL